MKKTALVVGFVGLFSIILLSCRKESATNKTNTTQSQTAKLKKNTIPVSPVDYLYISYPGAFHDDTYNWNWFDTLYVYHTNVNSTIHIFLEANYNGNAVFGGSEYIDLTPSRPSYSSYAFQQQELNSCTGHHAGQIGVFVDEYKMKVVYVLDSAFNDITSQVRIIPDIYENDGTETLTARTSANCIPIGGSDTTKDCHCTGLGVIKTPKKL